MSRKPRKRRAKSKYVSDKKQKADPSLGFFDIPFEMREMIILEMDAKSRCKLAQCSTKCEIEVKRSKYHIYGLNVFDRFDTSYICVKVGDKSWHHSRKPDYAYSFNYDYSEEDPESRVYVSYCELEEDSDDLPNSFYKDPDDYFCENHEEKWTKVEDGDMKTVVLKYLTNYLDTYHNSIREFEFRHEMITVHDFNVKHLRRLRALEVTQQREDLLTSGFINFNQLSKMIRIWASETNLTFEQLCEFQGTRGCLRCNDFDDKTIKKYLEMIKRGEKDNQLLNFVIMTPRNENLNMDYYTENLKSREKSDRPGMAAIQEICLMQQAILGPEYFGFTCKTFTDYRLGVAQFSIEEDSITVMAL
ncbi:unnamed protein product [Caenorhabditis angaria]|uniref:F-box domain-containing protein n=1 Tax=Caenorhabditis angaria TaxID=860376 RepID=A0A9P1I5W0_9PELO|nr:unnamed protein product [Caenorhabditis angaria]